MTQNQSKTPLSYRDAGVDIDAGNQLVERIKSVTAATHRPEVLGGIGGFGALVEIPEGFRRPILVSGTDGVGTKLRLAMDAGRHDTIGIDLVAMCSNDIAVVGAEPLLFLDYYATGRLNVEVAASVVAGIGAGCQLAGCALVGGETAEMPGMYDGDDYDLAGFCVGVVEKDAIIDGSRVAPGDQLIALASSGPHSNGYSLIRKIIEVTATPHDTPLAEGRSLIDALLEPTRIYNKPLLALQAQHTIHAMAHITGGGILENLPRVLPAGCGAHIDLTSWRLPPVFDWLQRAGQIEEKELYRTFNCGVGMILAVPAEELQTVLVALDKLSVDAWHVGEIRDDIVGVSLSS